MTVFREWKRILNFIVINLSFYIGIHWKQKLIITIRYLKDRVKILSPFLISATHFRNDNKKRKRERRGVIKRKTRSRKVWSFDYSKNGKKREEKSAGNAILRHLHFLVDRMATAARRSRDVIIMFPPSFVEQTTDVARDKGPAWRFCGFAGRPPNFRTHEDPRFFPLSRTPPFTPPSIHYDGSDHETIGSAGSKEETTSFLLTALISKAIEKRKNLVEDCSFRTILKQTLLEGDV